MVREASSSHPYPNCKAQADFQGEELNSSLLQEKKLPVLSCIVGQTHEDLTLQKYQVHGEVRVCSSLGVSLPRPLDLKRYRSRRSECAARTKNYISPGPRLTVFNPATEALLDECASDSFKVSYLTNHQG